MAGSDARNVIPGLRQGAARNDDNSLFDSTTGGRRKQIRQGFSHVASDYGKIAVRKLPNVGAPCRSE